MHELLNIYFTVDRLGPVLALLAVVGTFAAVRRSERIKPEKKADG
ncbi:hypothetical protein GCM10023063_16600 [Arthrobacter methylotrophus]|uniref:Uncharacterized protein n=1 Tax=Arthrobacter methylotrophus TaxID=121291 RepID=A0ABV5URL0_9MICC